LEGFQKLAEAMLKELINQKNELEHKHKQLTTTTTTIITSTVNAFKVIDAYQVFNDFYSSKLPPFQPTLLFLQLQLSTLSHPPIPLLLLKDPCPVWIVHFSCLLSLNHALQVMLFSCPLSLLYPHLTQPPLPLSSVAQRFLLLNLSCCSKTAIAA
jgi:hypothetical protein